MCACKAMHACRPEVHPQAPCLIADAWACFKDNTGDFTESTRWRLYCLSRSTIKTQDNQVPPVHGNVPYLGQGIRITALDLGLEPCQNLAHLTLSWGQAHPSMILPPPLALVTRKCSIHCDELKLGTYRCGDIGWAPGSSQNCPCGTPMDHHGTAPEPTPGPVMATACGTGKHGVACTQVLQWVMVCMWAWGVQRASAQVDVGADDDHTNFTTRYITHRSGNIQEFEGRPRVVDQGRRAYRVMVSAMTSTGARP
ncbi:hypothetical protein JB92DRAFT_2830724 [Gautieria morchelliformis]|nr:hypothetical protein JB92DRAFT_2830724 [Gautieria morchelliformis]